MNARNQKLLLLEANVVGRHQQSISQIQGAFKEWAKDNIFDRPRGLCEAGECSFGVILPVLPAKSASSPRPNCIIGY